MPTTPTNDLLLKMHAALRAYYNNGGTWAAYKQAKREYESQAPEHLEDDGQRVLVQTGEDTAALVQLGVFGTEGSEIGR